MARVIPGVTERRIKPVDVKQYGVQGYDADNKYPQRIKYTIAASGTGVACTRLFSKYLKGRGFADAEVSKTPLNNSGQTLTDIHALVCQDYALYRGFALHIGYNALLQIISIKHVPFEFVRLNLPDDLENVSQATIYDDWGFDSGKKTDRKRFKTVDLYTTNVDKINSQIAKAGDISAWNGHLFYYSEDGALVYPKSPCDSVLEDVVTDSKVKIYKWRNTENGFMASHVYAHPGKFESDEAAEEFVNNLNAYQGADSSHKIMVVEVEDPAQMPQVVPFETPSKDKEFEYTESSVRENIIRAYGQPLVLHAVRTAGSLGESTEWEDAKKNYDERTEEERDRIAMVITKLMQQMNPAITEDQLKVIPITGVQDKTAQAVLAIQFGVGGTQSLVDLIANPGLSPSQKINTLVIVFGIAQDKAASLVNGTPIPQS